LFWAKVEEAKCSLILGLLVLNFRSRNMEIVKQMRKEKEFGLFDFAFLIFK